MISRGFDNAECEARTIRAQEKLASQNLAGLLLMTEPDIRYFTGFHTLFWQSPTRPWFLFVPQTGKPIAIIPEIGAALMAQSWIDDIDAGVRLRQMMMAYPYCMICYHRLRRGVKKLAC